MKLAAMSLIVILAAGLALAGEVEKGQIPADHLAPGFKMLPWNVQVWDVEEAVTAIKNEAKVLWVDTRPTSFFNQGTMRGAVLMVYDKGGASYPDGEPLLTKETLEAAMQAAGAETVAFFCQGPKCHRSYNAAYVAVAAWGMDPAKVVWFRDGYPNLFKAVNEDPKLKRKSGLFLCDRALATL